MQHPQKLLDKYHRQQLNEAEMQELEHYIATGVISLSDLEDLAPLQQKLEWLSEELRSERMRLRFREQLERKNYQPADQGTFNLPRRWRQWAAVLLLPLLGWAAAQWQHRQHAAETVELADVQRQLQEMREVLLLSLLEKESTSERLKAVHLTRDMQHGVGDRVIDALLATLNHDPNANVRLACIDELSRYTDQPRVREELIKSIRGQDSPLVLLSLAELMAELREKRAVEEFDRTLEEQNTPPEIRSRIRRQLQQFI